MSNQELREYITNLADELYQNRLESGIKKITELIGLLSEYVESADDNLKNAMIAQLKNIVEAMESKDYVLIADILVFEMLEIMDVNS